MVSKIILIMVLIKIGAADPVPDSDVIVNVEQHVNVDGCCDGCDCDEPDCPQEDCYWGINPDECPSGTTFSHERCPMTPDGPEICCKQIPPCIEPNPCVCDNFGLNNNGTVRYGICAWCGTSPLTEWINVGKQQCCDQPGCMCYIYYDKCSQDYCNIAGKQGVCVLPPKSPPSVMGGKWNKNGLGIGGCDPSCECWTCVN